VRLFVAINLPEHEKRNLAEAVRTLHSHDLPVRWVDADALHITLKFLGEVSDAAVPGAREALRRAAAGRPSFDVALHGLGAFPSLARPNILWIGSTLPAELADLQAAVEREFERLGFVREARAYRAHITIGRVKRDGVMRDRPLMDRIVSGFRYKGEMRVSSVELMRSHLGRGGARYEVIEKVELN
jgi:RNA 2',3'-cyclic 3'-phosphodiesterase